MSEHIAPEKALAYVALPADDPEALAARAHAEGCEACARLLAQGEQMLSMMEESEPRVRVPAALKARVEKHVAPVANSRSQWLMVAAFGLLSLLVALKDGQVPDVLMPALGVRCALFESGYAVVPLVVAAVLSRMGNVQLSTARFSAYTMGGALIGQLLLRTRCEAHVMSLHVFVFHFAVVIAWAAIGAGTARVLAARR